MIAVAVAVPFIFFVHVSVVTGPELWSSPFGGPLNRNHHQVSVFASKAG